MTSTGAVPPDTTSFEVVRVTRGVQSVRLAGSAVVVGGAGEPPPAPDPELPPSPPDSEPPPDCCGAGKTAGPLTTGPVLISKLEDAVVAADPDHGVNIAVVV